LELELGWRGDEGFSRLSDGFGRFVGYFSRLRLGFSRFSGSLVVSWASLVD
jgi:hypothetical protein